MAMIYDDGTGHYGVQFGADELVALQLYLPVDGPSIEWTRVVQNAIDRNIQDGPIDAPVAGDDEDEDEEPLVLCPACGGTAEAPKALELGDGNFWCYNNFHNYGTVRRRTPS